ncbi:Mpo1-like protein [Pelatocladus sp. BLCC-F211]|uniref:Mpo1-like protein n=1 Tax=Pelatocladus sp. BLCC-F211 TaxID=3342752 RepID=UPI0035B887E6
MSAQKFNNFSEFYLFYLSQHTNRTCRRLHIIGLLLSLTVLIVVVATAQWAYLPIPLLIGYGFAWIGHFFFEKNKPATFTYPLLSFLGDFKMVKDILTRKVKF